MQQLTFTGAVGHGSRWGSPCTGLRGSGAAGWRGGIRPGLDEGEVSRVRDTAAFLVLFKLLLQRFHVELVIVANLLLSGLEALGHWDGAAHCREQGGAGEGRGLCCPNADGSLLPWRRALTHSGDGPGKGPQELAEKKPRTQKMQGEKPRSFLKVVWHRYCQESVAKALSLKISFSPRSTQAPGRHWEGPAGEEGGQASGCQPCPNSPPAPHDSTSQGLLKQMAMAPKKDLEEGTHISQEMIVYCTSI